MSGYQLRLPYTLYIWSGIAVTLLFMLALITGSAHAAAPHTLNAANNNPLATPTPCPGNYAVTQSTNAAIVPGTTLVPGTQCDECVHSVTLPFAYSLYSRSFTQLTVTANGQLVFGSPVDPSYSNACLPDIYSNYAIFGHWTDLTMDTGYVACSYCGIFTSVSGSSPNRIFNIEWRAISFDNQLPVNFEIRLYEGQSQFEIIYGNLDSTHNFSGLSTVGVQSDTGSTYTQVQCPTQSGIISTGLKLLFSFASQCGSTPTPVPPTATPTYTPILPTSTPTRTTVPPTATYTRTPTSTYTPLPPTASPTNTPVTSAYLTGHVTFQGRPAQPNALQQLPVVITLTLGTVTRSYSTGTDPGGYFTVNVSGLVPGTYSYRVKGTKQLSNSGTVLLAGAPNTGMEMGLLRAGDANNDDLCNIADYNILKPPFGKSCGDPGYDDRADFTGDCMINVADFLMMKYNFGMGGGSPRNP